MRTTPAAAPAFGDASGPRWLIAIGVVLLWLHVAVFDRSPVADDAYFTAALDHVSLWAFLQERYVTWSGRLPQDALAAVLMHHVWLWRALNIGMVALLCASVARLGFGACLPRAPGIACAFALWLLLPPELLGEAAWWVTGSLNYLWPAALGAWAMVALFERSARPAREWLLLGFAAGFAAYCEQLALAMCALGLPRWWLLRRSGRFGLGDAWMMAMLLANAAVNFAAPGARLRYSLETVRWFPDYDLLALSDKLHLGLGLVATSVTERSNLLTPLLVAATIALLVRSPLARGVRAALVAGLAGLALLLLVPHLLPPGSGEARKLVVASLSATNGATVLRAVALCAALFGIGCLAIGAGAAVVRERGAAWWTWAVAVGMGTIFAVAFSPTVFASGQRTRFVGLLVMVVVACRLLACVRARFGDSAFRRTMAAVAVVAAARLVALSGG